MNIFDRHMMLLEEAPDRLHIIDDDQQMTRHQFAQLVDWLAEHVLATQGFALPGAARDYLESHRKASGKLGKAVRKLLDV